MLVSNANFPGVQRKITSIFLKAGDVFASDKPHIVCTVLGSCVSICLWDRRQRVGGMNHFQQPGGDHADFLTCAKAIYCLVQRMDRLGCKRSHLNAMVFGGARVIDAFVGVSDIGTANIAAAEFALDEIGIAMVYRHVGGTRGRKVFFRTDTGGYGVKLLPREPPSAYRPTSLRMAGGKTDTGS